MGPDVIKEIMRDQPIARLGRSDEIAASVLWLCSPGASFVLCVAFRFTAALQLIEAQPKLIDQHQTDTQIPAETMVADCKYGHH